MNFFGRAVFDTSTLVSAALRVDSVPSRALLEALADMRLCVSEATLLELRDVLLRSKFERCLPRPERTRFVELIERHGISFDVADAVVDSVTGCRDATDRKFLALALVCHASALVSCDADLLALHPFRGIPVVLPADFLAD
ncbi:MAG: putative toxin-antitoxin system toxin component, PIN family [Pseudomonadota bacterium]|nr:putative toxin-antitoxin system toxin component, PIN family [Pseudomonadota bacterium]